MLFVPNIDSVATVLAIRAKAIDLLSQGATVMSWSNEGTSVTKQTLLPISTILRETELFLKTVDPETYGRKVTRTQARFN